VRSVFPRSLGTFYERREPGRGRAIGLQVAEGHCNAHGFAHGGFLLTLLDFAMSYGSADADDFLPGITLSLTTNFLRPAPLGAWLEAHVTVERTSTSVTFNRCALMHGDVQIASAQGVFRPVPPAPAVA
jgi:acyl-coenzyme A thioesterase PaaI-like protein